ncbi:MAG: protein kinase [Propionibacteriaceae bacterium]|nr:protein kinase [Propionibacteriaceae bacterium]
MIKGDLIDERYLIGNPVGQGGMAGVHHARDLRLKRDVAIKQINANLVADAVSLKRFRREAEHAARLNHPNIVSVFDTGEYTEPGGRVLPYIVMEFVWGQTIRQILNSGSKFPLAKTLKITISVLEALEYSHNQGIVHRDIKPANIMITNAGKVKVVDFGIARLDGDESLTQAASTLGTPHYLSPEQLSGKKADRRTDIYATGCMFYELLTGKPPFDGDSPVAVALEQLKGTLVPPSQVNRALTTAIDEICVKALAKDPAHRYQTAAAMAKEIAHLLDEESSLPPLPAQPLVPPPPPPPVHPPAPVHPQAPVRPPAGAPVQHLSPVRPAPVQHLAPARPGVPTAPPPPTRSGYPAPQQTLWQTPAARPPAPPYQPPPPPASQNHTWIAVLIVVIVVGLAFAGIIYSLLT